MNVNAIYPAFDGEVNKYGIGAPTIFLRLQGCHLRCYLKTKGILCDTPEGLAYTDDKQMSIDQIIQDLNNIRATSGIDKVSLSGGDPLARPVHEMLQLFDELQANHYKVTVETSGTLSIFPYIDYDNVSWVLDYKLQSCGIEPNLVRKTFNNFPYLKQGDFVKFVVENWDDYKEMKAVVRDAVEMRGQYAVGLFWGSEFMTNLELFEQLVKDGLTEKVVMNFQTHKLIVAPNFKTEIPALI